MVIFHSSYIASSCFLRIFWLYVAYIGDRLVLILCIIRTVRLFCSPRCLKDNTPGAFISSEACALLFEWIFTMKFTGGRASCESEGEVPRTYLFLAKSNNAFQLEEKLQKLRNQISECMGIFTLLMSSVTT